MAHNNPEKVSGRQEGNCLSQARFAHSGFGLALLMVFLSSSLLLASSLSLILAPSVTGYVGSSSLSNTATKQVAQVAFDAAQADILTKLTASTTVDTSYRYPASGSNTVSMPTYPGSGATAAVGSYVVTITQARGFTYLLKATSTVQNVTLDSYKLLQLSTTPSPFAIYSLRKVNSNYLGSAVRVRCAYTTLTQDIGFTGTGDLDRSALNTCLGDTALPLDAAPGAKLAYGLRRLSSTYSGALIKVRRSSDNQTQDIGFDSDGDLDIQSLLTFAGTGNAYVDTWYDQSGNVRHLTPNNGWSGEPRIVNAGVLDRQNHAPAMYFMGTQALYNGGVGGGFVAGADITSFLVTEIEGNSGATGRIAVLHQSSDSLDYGSPTSMHLLSQVYNSTTDINNYTNLKHAIINSVPHALFQSSTTKTAAGNLNLYMNGTVGTADTGATNSIGPDMLVVGAGANDTSITDYFTGYVSELIIYNTALSTANRQKIERSEGHYYNIAALRDGFVTTWYDQSGNSRNLTQATTTMQPAIEVAGIRPAAYFDGTDDYISNSSFSLTTNVLTGFGVARLASPAPANGRVVSVGKTGDGNDWGSINSSALISKNNNNVTNSRGNDLSIPASFNQSQDLQVTIRFDGTSRIIRQYQTGDLETTSTTTNGSGNLVINTLRLGWPFTGGAAQDYWAGSIYEVILYPTNLNTSNYQGVESVERAYYGI
jgi:hypothetical protein